MAGDVSAYGVGAVISHIMPDGTEHSIAFASRTLSSSERNYAQVEKEALSLVFGVKQFHNYLYGRNFTLVTDHKPLTTILGPKKCIPPLAAARLQRWAIILSAYTYQIEFRPTQAHANADGLSRLPLSDNTTEGRSSEPRDFNISQIESIPVTSSQLRRATYRDILLSKVLKYTKRGWPTEVKEPLRPFWNRQDELTIEDDCLLWGGRVVIPLKLRAKLLEELHRDHSGMMRMKAVARSYLWWPGLDREIEEMVRGCQSCQAVKNAPPGANLQPWAWPPQPWKRVHLDFAGPVEGSMFLLAVDAHSKRPEIHEMSSTTVVKTIEVLQGMFASYGLPEQIVTDNGPQFTATDFANFMKANGIRHTRSAPYHPASNGLAERLVQSFKQAVKAGRSSGRPLSHRLANFLLSYRTTPHATTGKSPSQLFLKRDIRTRFDLLKPDCERHVLEKQSQQKESHDKAHYRDRKWFIGQRVMARNVRPGPNWIPATIVEVQGPVTYLVETEDGQVWKCHLDQLKEIQARRETTEFTSVDSEFPFVPPPESEETIDSDTAELELNAENNTQGDLAEMPESNTTTPRYPSRNRQPPDRLMAYGLCNGIS